MDEKAAWATYTRGIKIGVIALFAGPLAALATMLVLEESGVPGLWAERAGWAVALIVVGVGAAMSLRCLWPVRGRGFGEMRATAAMATLCAVIPIGFAVLTWKALS